MSAAILAQGVHQHSAPANRLRNRVLAPGTPRRHVNNK